MAIKRMTLESVYNKSLAEYIEKGHNEESWQWKDEGRIYAIQDYLSSCVEMDNADWEFARRKGIEDECEYELKEQENN